MDLRVAPDSLVVENDGRGLRSTMSRSAAAAFRSGDAVRRRADIGTWVTPSRKRTKKTGGGPVLPNYFVSHETRATTTDGVSFNVEFGWVLDAAAIQERSDYASRLLGVEAGSYVVHLVYLHPVDGFARRHEFDSFDIVSETTVPLETSAADVYLLNVGSMGLETVVQYRLELVGFETEIAFARTANEGEYSHTITLPKLTDYRLSGSVPVPVWEHNTSPFQIPANVGIHAKRTNVSLTAGSIPSPIYVANTVVANANYYISLEMEIWSTMNNDWVTLTEPVGTFTGSALSTTSFTKTDLFAGYTTVCVARRMRYKIESGYDGVSAYAFTATGSWSTYFAYPPDIVIDADSVVLGLVPESDGTYNNSIHALRSVRGPSLTGSDASIVPVNYVIEYMYQPSGTLATQTILDARPEENYTIRRAAQNGVTTINSFADGDLMITYLIITLVPEGWDQTYLPLQGAGVDAAGRFKMGFRSEWYKFSSINQPPLYQPTKHDLLEYSFIANFLNNANPDAPNFKPLSTNYGHVSHGDEFRFYNARMYSTSSNVKYNTNMSLTPEGMKIIGNEAARVDLRDNYLFNRRYNHAGVPITDGDYGWDACTIAVQYHTAAAGGFSFVLSGWAHDPVNGHASGKIATKNSKNYPGIVSRAFYIQVYNSTLQVELFGPSSGSESGSEKMGGGTVDISTFQEPEGTPHTIKLVLTWNRRDGATGTWRVYCANVANGELTRLAFGGGSRTLHKTIGMHQVDDVRVQTRYSSESTRDVTLSALSFKPLAYRPPPRALWDFSSESLYGDTDGFSNTMTAAGAYSFVGSNFVTSTGNVKLTYTPSDYTIYEGLGNNWSLQIVMTIPSGAVPDKFISRFNIADPGAPAGLKGFEVHFYNNGIQFKAMAQKTDGNVGLLFYTSYDLVNDNYPGGPAAFFDNEHKYEFVLKPMYPGNYGTYKIILDDDEVKTGLLQDLSFNSYTQVSGIYLPTTNGPFENIFGLANTKVRSFSFGPYY